MCVTTYRAIVALCRVISEAVIWLTEPQHNCQCRSMADPIFSGRNKSDQSELPNKYHTVRG
jgi:hypothetical protein